MIWWRYPTVPEGKRRRSAIKTPWEATIRAVSEYPGHHDPGFTLRTYAHLMPESEDRTRLAMDSAHGAPAESMRNGTAGRT
jgi:hypothetical protein